MKWRSGRGPIGLTVLSLCPFVVPLRDKNLLKPLMQPHTVLPFFVHGYARSFCNVIYNSNNNSYGSNNGEQKQCCFEGQDGGDEFILVIPWDISCFIKLCTD